MLVNRTNNYCYLTHDIIYLPTNARANSLNHSFINLLTQLYTYLRAYILNRHFLYKANMVNHQQLLILMHTRIS